MTTQFQSRIVLFVLFLFTVGKSVHAEYELKNGIENACKNILFVMDKRQAETITVLGVEDGTTLGATISSGIERMIKDELNKSGRLKNVRGTVGVKARIVIAEYPRFDAAKETELSSHLRIEFFLTDAFGRPIGKFDGEYLVTQHDQRFAGRDTIMGKDGKLKQLITIADSRMDADIDSPEALLIAFGGNGKSESLERMDGLRSAVDVISSPSCIIAGENTAKLDQSSSFGIQIIGKYGPKKLRILDGQPFVDFEPNERFTIRFENTDTRPLAATITIDGLNSFYFSEIAKQHKDYWIIPQKVPLNLEGWYVRSGVADKFVATTFDEGKRRVAGLSRDPIGAISVLVRTAVRKSYQEERIGVRTIPREGGGTAQVEITYPVTLCRQEPTYIGGAGQVAQAEGSPSNLTGGESIGIISIRYRHPAQ